MSAPAGPAERAARVDRERAFHERLSAEGFGDRRLVARLGGLFYDKSRLWAPAWQRIGDPAGLRVLDLACGDGSFAVGLAERGARVHGIDISPSLIRRAEKRGRASEARARVEFSVRDAHDTGFRAGSFDLVVGNGSLHHLDLDRALPEIARVLTIAGRAYFVEPLDLHPAVRLFRRLTPRARTPDERPLRLEDLAQAHGWFSTVRHRETYLLAVASAPLGLASRAIASGAFHGLTAADRALFRAFPRLRRYAWITLIELER